MTMGLAVCVTMIFEACSFTPFIAIFPDCLVRLQLVERDITKQLTNHKFFSLCSWRVTHFRPKCDEWQAPRSVKECPCTLTVSYS